VSCCFLSACMSWWFLVEDLGVRRSFFRFLWTRSTCSSTFVRRSFTRSFTLSVQHWKARMVRHGPTVSAMNTDALHRVALRITSLELTQSILFINMRCLPTKRSPAEILSVTVAPSKLNRSESVSRLAATNYRMTMTPGPLRRLWRLAPK
jgi:hypothetical protein